MTGSAGASLVRPGLGRLRDLAAEGALGGRLGYAADRLSRKYAYQILLIEDTRLLNEKGIPTRKQISGWERSTVWVILRNPAYKGTACFGKTEVRPRQRVTRPLRMRSGVTN